jgi:hypothetical protein
MRLREFSITEPAIRRDLVAKGYRFLGQGVDQMAFMAPDGDVLKVFGTQCKGNNERPKISKDQKMFRFYAEYCQRNANNPHLPRIHGWETFVYPTRWGWDPNTYKPKTKQCLYLQIRTEPLKKFNNRFARLFQEMSDTVTLGVDWKYFHEDMQEGDVYDVNPDWYRRLTNNADSVSRMHRLYMTMDALYQIGRERGYRWDLHGDNIMARGDGTPVITDPWVL